MRCQAGPILVPAEQDWPIALPHHDIRVFEDRDAAMSLEDVATLDQHQFQPLDTVQIPTPSRSAWWLRFDVENIGQKPLDLRRSEGSLVGKGGVSTCRSRLSPFH